MCIAGCKSKILYASSIDSFCSDDLDLKFMYERSL